MYKYLLILICISQKHSYNDITVQLGIVKNNVSNDTVSVLTPYSTRNNNNNNLIAQLRLFKTTTYLIISKTVKSNLPRVFKLFRLKLELL